MTLDVDVVALGGGMTGSPELVPAVRAELVGRERVVPVEAPLGCLGAILAGASVGAP